MSSPAPFDWKSLITPAVALGSKAIGDALAPSADLKSVNNTAAQNKFTSQLALQKLAQANQIRKSVMPGMYTTLGYTPQQGQQLTTDYGNVSGGSPSAFQSPPAPVSGSPGLGSKIAKGAAGIGMGVAPAVIGGLLHGGAALTGDLGMAAAGAPAGMIGGPGAGLGATLGGLATNPITIAAAGALAGGLIWKHTQAHPTADKWVQGVQAPFDNHMRGIDQQNLPPAQAQAAKLESGKNYLTTLLQFAQGGGHNLEVARNAAQTFRQYYGDPAKYGVPLQF